MSNSKTDQIDKLISLLNNADDYDIEIEPMQYQIPIADEEQQKYAQRIPMGKTRVVINLIDIEQQIEGSKRVVKAMRHKADHGNEIDELKSKLTELIT